MLWLTVAFASLAVLFGLFLALQHPFSATATADIARIAIDTDITGTTVTPCDQTGDPSLDYPCNNSTVLGPTDTCRGINVGESVQIDVIGDAIPAGGETGTDLDYAGTGGTDMALDWTPSGTSGPIRVTGRTPTVSLAHQGLDDRPGGGFDSTSPTSAAGVSGHWTWADVDANTDLVGEGGPGIGLRITIKGINPGTATLSLGAKDEPAAAFYDIHGNVYSVDQVQGATIVVGATCSGGTLTPTATPSPSPTPSPTPFQTPTPTPTPSPVPTPSPTPSPTPNPAQVIQRVAIDMDTTNTTTTLCSSYPCNGSTVLGPTNACRSISVGQSIDIDVIASSIPAGGNAGSNLAFHGTGGTDLSLNWTPAGAGGPIQVTGKNTAVVIAHQAPGDSPGTYFDPTSGPQSTSGNWNWTDVDVNPNQAGEGGPGILLRLTITGINTGTTTLSIDGSYGSSPTVYDAYGNIYSLGQLDGAAIGVGVPCPCPSNPGAPDADNDTRPDSCDNCPAWANPSLALPDWPIPSGDSDCDGFTDTISQGAPNPIASELFLGTNAGRHCMGTSDRNDEAGPDAWPPDFDDNQKVNGSDNLTFAPVFFGVAGDGRYKARWDLNADSHINGSDILKLSPFFYKYCV